MNKEAITFRVVSNQQLSGTTHLLKLRPSDTKCRLCLQAGQFVQVLPPNGQTLLRRPISVCYFIEETNELWLLVSGIGRGTKAINDAQEGDELSLILPLGNIFNTDKAKKPLLVGGGVGIAPMLALTHAFSQRGIYADVILGGRSKEHILLLSEFESLGAKVFITTNDGSMGLQGLVTDHSAIQRGSYDAIYTCGPRAMMRAVALLAEERDIYCEVSLENTMACGIGACLCCVEDIIEEGNVCVCTEGPVFNAKSIKW